MIKSFENFPFHEVVTGARKRMADGWTIFQKFSCEKCMQRLTMPEPNIFFTIGNCDKCGHVTDILASGCNIMAVRSSDPSKLADLIIATRYAIEAEEVARQFKQ